jgi:hypothetical protein
MVMITTQYGNKILEAGDTIVCKGIRAEIASINFQEYWGENEGFYTEFRDTNGNYRNWKQGIDGGYVLPRESEVVL